MVRKIPKYYDYEMIGRTRMDAPIAIANAIPSLVARGLVEGSAIVQRFGGALSVGSTLTPVTLSNAYQTPQTAQQLEVVSDSANDDGGSPQGSGAQTVRIHGLTDWNTAVTEDVTLAGLTPVATANQYLRVYKMEVLTAGTHIDLAAANTLYPVIGIRLKSTALDGVVSLVDMSQINQASQDWEWSLVINPTLSSALSWTDQTNSVVQTAIGDGTATATGGTLITGGYVTSGARGASTQAQLENALRLGASIAGTPDEIYLCARPLAANADIEAGLTWRELS